MSLDKYSYYDMHLLCYVFMFMYKCVIELMTISVSLVDINYD